jgi:hypothetical protein
VGKLIQPSNPTGSSLSLHNLTVVSVYVTTPAVSKQAIVHIDSWWLCLLHNLPLNSGMETCPLTSKF